MYPERKPIYDAYKSIIKGIIDDNVHKTYAQGSIDALNSELASTLKEISQIMLLDKKWPESGI